LDKYKKTPARCAGGGFFLASCLFLTIAYRQVPRVYECLLVKFLELLEQAVRVGSGSLDVH